MPLRAVEELENLSEGKSFFSFFLSSFLSDWIFIYLTRSSFWGGLLPCSRITSMQLTWIQRCV